MRILRPVQAALLLACILMNLLGSCKKDSGPATDPGNDPDPGIPETGTVTGTGTPTGPAVSATIGMNGGTITSADGLLKIDIPAGAFGTDQTVSIQPITNMNKAGTGTAYRLTPHGNSFSKPVKIRFSYSDSNFAHSIPAAIGASYQDAAGVWKYATNSVRDTANRTVTVTTDHFSDWTLFQMLTIRPWISFTDPGGTVSLQVKKTVKDLNPIGDLPVPMPDEPIHDSIGAVVTDWSTSGGGFTLGTGSSATYYAPANLLEKNPVVITANVAAKGNEKWSLVAFVYVGKEGINYRMNNGPWINAPVPVGAIKVNDTLRMIQGVPVIDNQPAGSMSISWLGDRAWVSQPWTATLPAFQYGTGGIISYWQFKAESNNISISPGSLAFMDYVDDYVTGTFLLTKAGKQIATLPTPQWQEARFEGFFRVKWKK